MSLASPNLFEVKEAVNHHAAASTDCSDSPASRPAGRRDRRSEIKQKMGANSISFGDIRSLARSDI